MRMICQRGQRAKHKPKRKSRGLRLGIVQGTQGIRAPDLVEQTVSVAVSCEKVYSEWDQPCRRLVCFDSILQTGTAGEGAISFRKCFIQSWRNVVGDDQTTVSTIGQLITQPISCTVQTLQKLPSGVVGFARSTG